MLPYLTRTAWRSLRRNPLLSLLLMAGIGLGIGVSTTFVAAMHQLSGNPIPARSGRLFYVEMDSWNPDRPWDDDDPRLPPSQMTWMDVRGIMSSDIPTHQSAMYKADLTVHPASKDQRPFRAVTRLCFADFFTMFDVPFLYGSGWDRRADAGPEAVVVLDGETNRRLFGGENSVGRTVRIEERDFTVVGVMAPWQPLPKFYDPHNGPFRNPEALYIPFNLAEPMEIRSSGNNSNWKSYDGSSYAAMLASESVWLQMWVQLDDEAQRERYHAFLDTYAMEQKKLGRFQRPINNRLLDVMAWLEDRQVVPDEARSMLIIALLFLVVCSVNLIGILLSKFLARAPEVGIRRALGASRRSVFLQHILECEIIAVAGGVLGLGLSLFGLRILEALFSSNSASFGFRLDLEMALAGMTLSLFSGLLAGLYPSWRICRISPALHLKSQ